MLAWDLPSHRLSDAWKAILSRELRICIGDTAEDANLIAFVVNTFSRWQHCNLTVKDLCHMLLSSCNQGVCKTHQLQSVVKDCFHESEPTDLLFEINDSQVTELHSVLCTLHRMTSFESPFRMKSFLSEPSHGTMHAHDPNPVSRH